MLVDVDRDGVFDYDVFAADHGAVTTGSFDGISAAFVLTLVGPRAGTISFAGFATTADFNGTTMEIPFLYSQLCRVTTPATPCYSATSGPVDYTVVGFGWNGTSDEFVDTATFDFFHPAVSSTNFEDVVAPGASATDTVSIDKAQYQLAKPLGVMILSQNNLSHDNREEALTVPVPAGLVR